MTKRIKQDIQKLLDIPDLNEHLQLLNQKLLSLLPENNSDLKQIMEQVINMGGKRLRPSLTMAIIKECGKPINDDVINCCTAIELAHLASLIHDDIIDGSNQRGHLPSTEKQVGTAKAIVAGDYLLALANYQAALVSQTAASTIARAIADMCDSQALELTDQYNDERTLDNYYHSISGKTSALIAAACQFGGECAALSKSEIEALTKFGVNLGISFQILDDLMDLLSTSELLGKPVQQDILAGTYTLPVLLALSCPNSQIFRKLLKTSPLNNAAIIDFMKDNGIIELCFNKVKEYNDLALTALSGNHLDKHFSILAKLPEAYLKYNLTLTSVI